MDGYKQKTILLVEDEAMIALSEAEILKTHGYKVITVNSGEKAVQIVNEEPYIDIILMDIDLGRGIDGTQAAEKILEKHNLPIIFLSSHIEKEVVEKTEGITSYGYIVKDCSETVFIVSVKMAFRLFESRMKEQEIESHLTSISHNFTNGLIFQIIRRPDDTRKFTYLSDSVYQLFGVSPEEGIADANLIISKIYPEDFRLFNILAEEAVKNKKQSFSVDLRVIDPSGKTQWHSIVLTIKNMSDGSICLDGIGFVITKKKLSEDALRLRESFLSAIIENQPGLLWLKDLDSRFLAVNKKFAVSCGLNNQELLIGKTDYDIWPQDLAAGYVAVDMEVIKSGKPNKVEEPIPEQGKIRWFETYKTPILDKNGEVIGTTGYSNDITERKLAEDKIKTLLAEKELIIKEVHHRVKNYLSTIISLLSLQSKQVKNKEAAKILEDAEKRIVSMHLLYNKLYQETSFSEISIREYLEPLVKEIADLFPNREIVKFKTQIDDFKLHKAVLSTLGLIVNELITNAMKYAFTGRNEGLITVSALKKDGHVILTIGDNGIGMPESIDFESTDSFGLNLLSLLARKIDGTIRLVNEPGIKFIIEFES